MPSAADQEGTAVTTVSDPPRSAAGPLPALGHFVRATTTPAKLRLLLVGLVSLCLIWGEVAAWVVSQRASGANDVASTSETLSLDGQMIYRALSDADATADSAFLSGGPGLIGGPARLHRRGADRAGRQPARPAAGGGLPAGGVGPHARQTAPGRPQHSRGG